MINFNELALQMDNGRSHSAARTHVYLEQAGVNILPQSTYSPDLNMCDRFLFTRLQEHCRKVVYSDANKLYREVQRFLKYYQEELLNNELNKLR